MSRSPHTESMNKRSAPVDKAMSDSVSDNICVLV